MTYIKELSYDLVVIGGGGSGMVAAVRAAEAGKKVLILERAKRTGGSMLGASTMRTFQSRWQHERALPDVTDAFARSMMDLTYWRLDARLVGNAYRATGEFFDWFCALDPTAADKFRVGRYVFDGEDGPLGPQMGGHGQPAGGKAGAPAGPPLTDKEGGASDGAPPMPSGSGRYFMETLAGLCPKFGADILTSHRAVDVEVSDGRITAVIAEGPEGVIRAACRACVIACGSWIKNDAVMEKVCPAFLRADMGPSAHASPNCSGDGIAFAEKAGALVDYASFCLRLMGPMAGSRNPVLSTVTGTPFCILVNKTGRRYVCEGSESRMGIFESGHVQLDQPDSVSYFVFDINNLEACLKAIGDGAVFENKNNGFYRPPAYISPEEARAGLAQVQNDGQSFSADTIEALAGAMGVDPEALRETVAQYNEDCEKGFDWTCFKDKKYLVPIARGPFYAVKGTLGTDGAFGGVPVDPNMRAYAADKGIVDGLYVTGDFASGRFINQGGVKKQVLNDMSWALASGYLAGTDVVRYLDESV